MLDQSPDILFHSEDVDFELDAPSNVKSWVTACILKEEKPLGLLNFIFCSDQYLYALNVEFLDHDTFTDVITFPLSDQQISGDIFISVDRVKENSDKYKVEFNTELKRVMIHGVLHLCGYGDKELADKKVMREKENFYLELS